jgi:protein SCO1/2
MGSRRGLLAAMTFIVALGAYRIVRRPAPSLPHLGAVPAFALTDQAGRALTDGDLRGKVYVADFIFTRCSGVCPVMTRRMGELGRWADAQGIDAARLRLISFSVDPERDTPERLRAYAREHSGDFGDGAARWSLLTGPLAAVEKAAVEGFKVGLSRERPGPGDPPGEGEGGMAILHGSRLVLVDAKGAIRGYYEADDAGLARLETDAARLIRSGGA